MPGIAGLEKVECYRIPGSDSALWDELPRGVVNHSKSKPTRSMGNERDPCVESAERLGWQVQIDNVIERQLLSEIYGGANASNQGADHLRQRVRVCSAHVAADDVCSALIPARAI
jgi:hypothetical protein